METDVAILGGGAAGLSAAREARRLGGRAVLVNNGPLGGDCTFTGCVPSKTVIEAAHAGLSFKDAFDRARHVVDRIASTESAERLRTEGVEVIDDEGAVVEGPDGKPALVVGGQIVSAKGVVLSLGSRPLVPPIPGIDDVDYLTTENLWDLRDPPATMAVIGGGAIGTELSQALAGLGVDVTLIEMAQRVLTVEEPTASAIALAAIRQAGVKVLTETTVTGVRRTGNGTAVQFGADAEIEVERILIAVGRRPNSNRGGLEEAGIALDKRGYVANEDDLSASVSGVYVAGDLSGRLQFTHAADYMGRIATNNILGRFRRIRPQRFNAAHIPWVTFTSPEIARIGMTEAQAATAVKGAMVAELPLEEHDRAIAAEATSGFIKLISGPRPGIGMAGGGRIIGATIVAPRAGEMIAEVALAARLGAFTGRLAQTVHAYPTWSYGVAKTAAQFFTTIEGRTARPATEDAHREQSGVGVG